MLTQLQDKVFPENTKTIRAVTFESTYCLIKIQGLGKSLWELERSIYV